MQNTVRAGGNWAGGRGTWNEVKREEGAGELIHEKGRLGSY